MRIFLITVLVLNFLFEGAAATALLLGPEGINATEMAPGGMWAMNYGFAALAIALAIVWIWPQRNNSAVVFAVMGVLSTFHILLTIALAIAGNQMGGMIAHSIMAVLCIAALTQRHKWCEPSTA